MNVSALKVCSLALVLAAMVPVLACEVTSETDADGGSLSDAAGGADDGALADGATADGGSGPDIISGGGLTVDEGGEGSLPVFNDPAPEATTAGATASCDGAPSVSGVPATLELTATGVYSIDGTVTGSSGPGTWYIESASGLTNGGQVDTDGAGVFGAKFPLFCGEQVLKLQWKNEACAGTWVTTIVNDGCTEPDIRATLGWDDLGLDWELHLIRPGGSLNDSESDCTWTTCISTFPDWGVAGDASDDPAKDIDDTGNFGPENIILSSPEAGIYWVIVEHWGDGAPESEGQLSLNVAGRNHRATYEGLPSRWVWLAATIEWPSGEVRFFDSLHDCAENWNGGCYASLP